MKKVTAPTFFSWIIRFEGKGRVTGVVGKVEACWGVLEGITNDGRMGHLL